MIKLYVISMNALPRLAPFHGGVAILGKWAIVVRYSCRGQT